MVDEKLNPNNPKLKNRPIAYFCLEYGVMQGLPLYAGGLGILAGDIILEAAKEDTPLVAIGLFYHRGFASYFQESGNEKKKIKLNPHAFGFDIVKNQKGQELLIDLEINDGIIYARAWSKKFGSVTLYLLDTDTDKNSASNRQITEFLYDTNWKNKICQEIVLGIGGVKLLRRLNIIPSIYHLNEGHTSFAALALAAEYLHDNPEENSLEKALSEVKHKIVSTKHTILSGSGIFLNNDQLLGLLSAYLKRHRINIDQFFKLGTDAKRSELFSTTKFLILSSIRANAVSILHCAFEKKDHPHSPLIPITNGVHKPRWIAESFKNIIITEISDAELWKKHQKEKRKLTDYIEHKTGAKLNKNFLTVVWARRFAPYKRPDLLFADEARLEKLYSDPSRPVQFIISGKPNIGDTQGIELFKKILAKIHQEKYKNKIVYLPDYSIESAKFLTRGADIWLNTPERGREACGTSSMKSGLNGVLQFSTSDGWIEEVDWRDKGWILPSEKANSAIYEILEKEIAPIFYNRNGKNLPEAWTHRMKNTISIIEEQYTAERMLKDYFSQLYFPEV